MRNVLAKIDGKNKDEIVIIGAHYDHIGYDPMLDGDQIYNGADDNASGVSAFYRLCVPFWLQASNQNVLLFCLLGRRGKRIVRFKIFCTDLSADQASEGYLNFDMIGRIMMSHVPGM